MSSDEQRLLAGRQVVVRVLADEVKQITTDTRAALEPQLDPEEAVVAVLPDGQRVGKVQRAKPAATAAVTDERALLAWVTAHRPDELVRSVRSSYVEALKAQARVHGHAYDPDTGEVIPGVELVEGTSAYRVTVPPEGRAAVLARLREVLSGDLIPQLPPASNGDRP